MMNNIKDLIDLGAPEWIINDIMEVYTNALRLEADNTILRSKLVMSECDINELRSRIYNAEFNKHNC